MLMDGQWYGYLRTASGNPLTLQNAKRLRKLTICGNAVQDGTPSPDAPVEVQLCGDRTGNLLSMRNVSASNIPVKSYNNGIIEVIGNSNYSGGRTTRLSEYITLEANQTYTLALYLVSGKVDSSINACLSRRENGNFYYGGTFSVAKRVMIITPDENVEVYLGLNLSQGDYNSTLRVAIYKGSYTADTLPAYEPYGYKVSGRAEGLNLFDINKYTYANGNSISTSNSTGAPWFGRFIDIDYAIELGKTYTLVCDYLVENASDTSTIRFGYATDRGMQVFTNGLKTVHGKGSIVFSVTVPESIDDYNNFSLYINSSTGEPSAICDKMTISNIMIVKGTYTAATMPPYEPYQPPQEFAVYLPEQIAKVGDVADEVVVDMESKTAELRKNVGSIETDCASVVSLNDNRITLQCRNSRLSSGLYQSAEHTEMLNKYFPYIPNNSVDTEGVSPNMVGVMYQTYVRINKSRIDITEEDTLETLADKCQAFLNTLNEPKTYYVLATPTTTDISALQQWDAMPQVSGTVTLTLSAEVEPSGTEAVYYSKERNTE